MTRFSLAFILAGAGAALSQSPGYVASSTRVVVSRASDWRAWDVAEGSAVIDAGGQVEPRRLRDEVNALLDAHRFEFVRAGEDTVRGGVLAVGSSPETADLIRDGDLHTGWSPSREDELRKWFIDVDLGRAVTAERIRVRFAAVGEGDPFLKFRIMASRQSRLPSAEVDIEFFRVGQVNIRNKEVREFEFLVKPQRRGPEGLTGEVIQTVRFEALDTDGARAEEVGVERYLGLPAQEQGAIDFYRQTVTGRTILVDERTWEALPEEDRGPVRYYRWEQPRLMELEVITPGQNIVHLTQIRINKLSSRLVDALRYNTTDGLANTVSSIRPYDPLRDDNQLEVDLGARYWLDRVRVVASRVPLSAYQLLLSDGAIDPNGERVWRSFEERLNTEQYLQIEERFPLQVVRHIQLRALQLVGTESESGLIAELQAYGQGYVSEIELTSPIIRLPGSRMFTNLSWVGDAPGDTRIEIRTRSGDELATITRYFDRFGREIGQDQWESARESNRGSKIETEVPGPLWSSWSELYRRSGESFRSPGPRRYAMVQVRLLSSNPARRASIRQLRVDLAPPLVDQAFAEIWPVRDVPPGVWQEFTVYLRPRFGPANPGFDRIQVHSSSAAAIELLAARGGSARELQFERGRDLLAAGARIERGNAGVELVLPAPVRAGSEEVISLRLRTQLFLSGTTFTVQLTSQDRPGVVQQVSEGEAVRHVASQRLVVISDLSRSRLLQDLLIEPAVMTPNGDDINDVVAVRFSVFRLRGDAQPRLTIYDLAGNLVRRLYLATVQPSGRHVILWDGSDEAGRRVSPGVYAARVEIDVDAAGVDAMTGLIHVAY